MIVETNLCRGDPPIEELGLVEALLPGESGSTRRVDGDTPTSDLSCPSIDEVGRLSDCWLLLMLAGVMVGCDGTTVALEGLISESVELCCHDAQLESGTQK